MVNVLPVPALASMRVTPGRSELLASWKEGGVFMLPPLFRDATPDRTPAGRAQRTRRPAAARRRNKDRNLGPHALRIAGGIYFLPIASMPQRADRPSIFGAG